MVTDNFPDISFIDNSTIEDVLTQMINDYQSKYKRSLTKRPHLQRLIRTGLLCMLVPFKFIRPCSMQITRERLVF